MSLSETYDIKTLIQYLSAIALAVFFLIYMPWTYLSAAVLDNVGLTWVYYFALVLGLLFPMYYAIGKENAAWLCLGLSLMINSIIWMALPSANLVAAVLVLFAGLLFFLAPFLEPRLGNWDLVKNLFHFLKGLALVLAVAVNAGLVLDDMIGPTSANHYMPQFIYMGGGIMIAFAFVLMCYGLFNIFKMYMGDTVGGFFGDLAKVFYMLMVLIFLLGILFNVTSYIGVVNFTPTGTSASIAFFAGMAGLADSNLTAILLLILFIYGMGKIASKFEQ